MTTTPYDDALAAVERLQEHQQQWTDKRAVLVQALTELEANAGQAALAGESTATLADQLSRLQSEIRIAEQALAALAGQQQQADQAVQLARIVDERQRALERFQAAAALREQAEPHLQALEEVEGVRFSHPHPRSARLEQEGYRWLYHAEEQAFRLPADVRRQLEVQRETQPTELDRALFAMEHPEAVQEEQAG